MEIFFFESFIYKSTKLYSLLFIVIGLLEEDVTRTKIIRYDGETRNKMRCNKKKLFTQGKEFSLCALLSIP
jgi:hypothetical protein